MTLRKHQTLRALNTVRRFARPALLSFALACLVLNSTLAYRSLIRLHEASVWVKHTLAARQTMAEVLNALLDAEAAHRGFLMIGDHRYLAGYHRATANVRQRLAALKTEISDNAEHIKTLKRLETLVSSKFSEMESIADTHIRQGVQASLEQLINGSNPALSDDIRSILKTMDAAEDHLLAERSETYSHERDTALFSLGIFIATVFVLLIAVYLFMRREVRQRSEAAADHLRYAAELDRSIRTLEHERNDIAAINEFSSLIQSCGSIEEVGKLTGAFIRRIFRIIPERSISTPRRAISSCGRRTGPAADRNSSRRTSAGACGADRCTSICQVQEFRSAIISKNTLSAKRPAFRWWRTEKPSGCLLSAAAAGMTHKRCARLPTAMAAG